MNSPKFPFGAEVLLDMPDAMPFKMYVDAVEVYSTVHRYRLRNELGGTSRPWTENELLTPSEWIDKYVRKRADREEQP